MSIQLHDISKRFGATPVLQDITLEVRKGELVALLGPSGSGKTTLLRVIAGLEQADKGRIIIEGREVTHASVQERQVGFVFQHYALFRHMSVFENIAFGLKVRRGSRRVSKQEIKQKVGELLALVKLETMAHRYPAQLSGGQRQRVALARALAIQPQILLLDEPFAALDANVREELRRWLRELHQKLGITGLFVTHDQQEALEIADRVVIMNDGRVEQIGTPYDVYHAPANPFVCGFIGRANRIPGRFDRNGQIAASTSFVSYVRPHDLEVTRQQRKGAFPAIVRKVSAVGPHVRLHLQETGSQLVLEAEMPLERYQALNVRENETVYVRPRTVKEFARDSAWPNATVEQPLWEEWAEPTTGSMLP
ncbi:sulfate/molybdate ABC transporter ATP-binding protein [Brevibacillus marinus]|uniref:sulfate/molybdate ABC transporter ATP-binding protein n=1 Tax=Brevibacillus marinus TaxID=2496837 RepID=UPI000F8425C0|nr:sulfate/molybdate ABC transporter ATP-binding protein [Brevibacillus marinus]